MTHGTKRVRVVSIDRAWPDPRWEEWAEWQAPPPEPERPARGILIGLAMGAVVWGGGWLLWMLARWSGTVTRLLGGR